MGTRSLRALASRWSPSDGKCERPKPSRGVHANADSRLCPNLSLMQPLIGVPSAHASPAPTPRLFFGYFFNGSTAVGVPMDDGHTEHTGCPLHDGKKWIATMWYREGVTADKDWAYWSARGREGV